MPNFLPRRLIEFEYLDGSSDEDYTKLASSYQKEIELAFFIVNFGMSKQEYESLRPIEKHFIYKAYENKLVSDTTHTQRAVQTAFYNVQRPKNAPMLPLWVKKVSRETLQNVKEAYVEMKKEETKESPLWVKKLYQLNGKGG